MITGRSVALDSARVMRYFSGIDNTAATMDFFMVRHTPRTPRPFRMEGVALAMTPHPDDAEMEAQALLDVLSGNTPRPRKDGAGDGPEQGSAEYYRLLSRRISDSRSAGMRDVLRCVVWCEQELMKPVLSADRLAEMEKELYRRLALVDGDGRDLKGRWQHCLAEVIVRQQPSEKAEPDTGKG